MGGRSMLRSNAGTNVNEQNVAFHNDFIKTQNRKILYWLYTMSVRIALL